MEKDNGGSAFPEIKTGYDGSAGEYTQNVYSEGGMTLRDYFAGEALKATAINYTPESAAQRAYEFADAMLKARLAE